MREKRIVKIDGVNAQVNVYRCDGGCRKLLDPTNKPIIVAQQALILQHPDGFNEVVHVVNEPAGRFRYYCLDCFYATGGCDATNDEYAKCRAALQRRANDLLALKKEEGR